MVTLRRLGHPGLDDAQVVLVALVGGVQLQSLLDLRLGLLEPVQAGVRQSAGGHPGSAGGAV